MPLTDIAIRNAKPKDKRYKISDSGGLFIEILPAGGKYWRMKYRLQGKENCLALGVYPTVTLIEARAARDTAKKQIAEGLNPAHERKREKQETIIKQEHSFKAIADEWLKNRAEHWSKKHVKKITNLLKKDVFPYLRARPIAEITAAEILSVIRRIEERDALHTSQTALQNCSQIFRYAIATSRASHNPAPDLRGALKTRPVKNMARIKETELPELLHKIYTYGMYPEAKGDPKTELALRLMVLTFVRTHQMRFAEWSEIDFKKKEWRIPPEKMKKDYEHIVPLSTQSITVLQKLHTLTGKHQWLFPSIRSFKKVMSENTILFALYRMGYHGRMTGHGFRGLASTILNEHGFDADWIERQLAHVEENKTRAAYNHAQYLTQRRKMMQWWADYLDQRMAENTLVEHNPFRSHVIDQDTLQNSLPIDAHIQPAQHAIDLTQQSVVAAAHSDSRPAL